jgi:phage terminase Nu1 subunit (DNA packaging protein)
VAKSQYITTQRELAREFDVSLATARAWINRRGFPTKHEKGWKRTEVRAFLKKHQLGQYFKEAKEQRQNGEGKTDALGDVRIKHLQERTRREQISRQIEEVELKKAMGEIVLVDDIEGMLKQLFATVKATLESLPDLVEREVPGKATNMKKLSARLHDVSARVVRNALKTIKEFKWRKR